MGMILTLYLISANVYNSVDAPKNRGFSFIEIWMIGTQIPILLALCEYGFILHLKKIAEKPCDQVKRINQDDLGQLLDEKIKKLDYASLIFTLLYFIIFVSVYSIIAYLKTVSIWEKTHLEKFSAQRQLYPNFLKRQSLKLGISKWIAL